VGITLASQFIFLGAIDFDLKLVVIMVDFENELSLAILLLWALAFPDLIK